MKLQLSFVLVGLSALTSSAQPYNIAWFKISGGGGTSAGGQFSLSGTIGQHDAGLLMTNSQYMVIGGFWALPQAVQVMDAPTLTIAPAAPGFATISWSPATPGFILQETPTLSLPVWINSPSGPTNPATVPISKSTKFYRLFKP